MIAAADMCRENFSVKVTDTYFCQQAAGTAVAAAATGNHSPAQERQEVGFGTTSSVLWEPNSGMHSVTDTTIRVKR